MAGWRSENAGVCKTLMRGFDSRSGLQLLMKKKLLTSLIVLGALFMFISNPKAQTLTFDRAYSDYQYNLTLYQQAYSDFQDAKNAYQINQTLALKETARQKLLAMLESRDQLMVVYLTALRTRISESTGLTNDEKDAIFVKIDAEVKFYANHKTRYGSDNDTSTLFNGNAESETQYKNTTQPIVQESLFDISLGDIVGIRTKQERVYSNLKNMIDKGVAAGTLTRDPFNNWLSDIDATDQTLISNENTAKNQIQKIYTQNYSYQGGYQYAINTLTSSVQPLTQYNEFLNEVLNYIKSKQ